MLYDLKAAIELEKIIMDDAGFTCVILVFANMSKCNIKKKKTKMFSMRYYKV